MKLLGSTKSKTTENGNGKFVPNLEINEVVLIHFNTVNNNCQRNLRVLYTFVSAKMRKMTTVFCVWAFTVLP